MSAEYKELNQLEVQSLCDYIESIASIEQDLKTTIDDINTKLRELIKCGYYNRVSITFRTRVYEAILFYQESICDLSVISKDMQERVTPLHFETLKRIAKTANNLNTSLRFNWKTDSYPDDFSEQRFLVLAHVYKDCATMFTSLESLERLAENMEESITE